MARRLTAASIVLLWVIAIVPLVQAGLGPPHRWCFGSLKVLREGSLAAARTTTWVCGGDEYVTSSSPPGPPSYVVTPAGTILCLHHGTGLDARAPRAILVDEGVADPHVLARANREGIFGDDGATSQLALFAVVLLALVWRLLAGRLGSTGRGLYLLVLPFLVLAGWPGMLAPMNSYYAPLVSRALWWRLMDRLAVALLVVEVVFEGVAVVTDAME